MTLIATHHQSRAGLREGHLLPAAVAVTVFLVVSAVLDPRMPFTLSEGVVEQQLVRPGDEVKIDWTQIWTRRCRAESVRTIVRADRKVDVYDKAVIEPPAKIGPLQAVAKVKLSSIMPIGPAIYRATVTFPAQAAWGCVLPWPRTFTTPDVPFTVSN